MHFSNLTHKLASRLIVCASNYAVTSGEKSYSLVRFMEDPYVYSVEAIMICSTVDIVKKTVRILSY